MINRWLVATSLVLTVNMAPAVAAGNAEDGQAKSALCAGCHGPTGNSPVNPVWPKLAGQYPNYIEKQLKDFKSGNRTDPTMTGMAAPLSEQDVADLAAYFSSQQRQNGIAAADQVTLGEKIYRGGNSSTGVPACMACHGPTGSGNSLANFPVLSGQHAAYVEKALKDFRAGTRANDYNKMMQGVTETMTDAEIVAVAQYIQGLHK